jgi:hypothetical protein
VTSEQIAAQLVAAATVLDRSPGLNVLDALGQVNRDASPALIGGAYFALLRYLDPRDGLLGPWSDRETNERAAARVRSAARAVAEGQSATHVAAAPGLPASAMPPVVAKRTEHGQPGWKRSSTRSAVA